MNVPCLIFDLSCQIYNFICMSIFWCNVVPFTCKVLKLVSWARNISTEIKVRFLKIWKLWFLFKFVTLQIRFIEEMLFNFHLVIWVHFIDDVLWWWRLALEHWRWILQNCTIYPLIKLANRVEHDFDEVFDLIEASFFHFIDIGW